MRPPPPLRNEKSSSSAFVHLGRRDDRQREAGEQQDQDVDVAQRRAAARRRSAITATLTTRPATRMAESSMEDAGWYRAASDRTERLARRVSLSAMARLDRAPRCSLFAACAERRRLAAPPWSAPESRLVAVAVRRQPRRRGLGGRTGASPPGAGAGPSRRRVMRRGGTRLAVREPGAPRLRARARRPRTSSRRSSRTASIAWSGSTPGGAGRAAGSRLRARFGNLEGTFGPPRTISTYQRGRRPAVAGRPERERSPRGSPRRSRRAPDRPRGDQVAGPVPASRHAAWPRAGQDDVVAGAGARRDVRRVGARGRGRGAGAGSRARAAGGRVQRLGPDAQGLDDRSGPPSPAGARYLAWLAQSGGVAAVAARGGAPGRRAPASGARAARSTRSTHAARRATHGRRLIVPIAERDALLAWTGWDGHDTGACSAAVSPGRAPASAPDLRCLAAPASTSVLGDAASVPPGTHGSRPAP